MKSLADLIALAKAKPGQYNFGSGGVGTWSHFSGEMFKSAAGIDIVHVPFRLLADWVTEMVAGRIHLYVAPLPAVMPILKSGKLRPLVVTTSKRVIARRMNEVYRLTAQPKKDQRRRLRSTRAISVASAASCNNRIDFSVANARALAVKSPAAT